ncbi:hypothetical protein BC826DRAFT_439150 [Russula brevipes]|nr:hypothetical protein BC826DRAFT_439150 [Russula brevipes]
MMSREGNFSSFTPRRRGGGPRLDGGGPRLGGGGPRLDGGNRYYVRGGYGYNSRGGRGGSSTAPDLPPEANIREGLNTYKVIETIPQPPRPSLLNDIPIENVQYVASYNWVDAEKPTIVVPGSPAVWTGRSVPFTLQPDDGSAYIDQNTARLEKYPMLPLFVAADAIQDKKAQIDWPTVDIITDRNGLRKLLRWLNPSPGREVRDFRIDVQLVGSKTIVLGRWEGMLYNRPQPAIGRNFGFAFEAATSRAAPGCPPSGHHRAIAYDMVDMKMVVRFEVDACLASEANSPAKAPAPAVDDLANALGNLSLQTSALAQKTTPPSPSPSPPPPSSPSSSPSPSVSVSSPSPAIKVIRAGTQVPQDALLEVASRSAFFIDKLDWNEIYPQLALSQTPALRLGVHERGTFSELREWQVDGAGADSLPGIATQRRETAAQMVRLARVLEEVQELAIARGPGPEGSFSLVCEGGELRAYARNGAKSCLPPDVIARFSGAGAGGASV